MDQAGVINGRVAQLPRPAYPEDLMRSRWRCSRPRSLDGSAWEDPFAPACILELIMIAVSNLVRGEIDSCVQS